MGKVIALLTLVLVCVASGVLAADQAPAKRGAARANGASRELRKRLDLYLRALKATPKELDALRAKDQADGIWLMERNPFLRARLELVAVLSAAEREALLKGGKYVSPPYAKLPKGTQALMDSALGTGRITQAQRDETRYKLQLGWEEDSEQLMISQVDPTGRPRSGGSVMPGVKRSPNEI
jgi:hypothetical protein